MVVASYALIASIVFFACLALFTGHAMAQGTQKRYEFKSLIRALQDELSIDTANLVKREQFFARTDLNLQDFDNKFKASIKREMK